MVLAFGLVMGLLFLVPAGLAATVANPILFVTQVAMPNEVNDNIVANAFASVVSPLGNHLADTAHAGRGGDLWIRYPDGTLRNLTRAAGFGVAGVQHGVGIGVRNPHVHWNGSKALFSMVVGAPTNAADKTTFYWQLYEITNFLNPASTPLISKVTNQPTNYNNVMGCYGTDGRIIFACDRPRNGASHLYPQLDEYNDIPTNTGLWSMDPMTGDLFQMEHSPSGSFDPFIDSFGRVIFTRWDHLVQDRNATDDRMARATNGTFDYFDEASTAYNISNRAIEIFPEPRTYDSNQLALLKLQGNAFNQFFPWMANEDGTAQELLNHIGRHELLQTFRGSSFTNDPNLVQTFNLGPGVRFNTNYLNNFLNIHEDPLNPGTYLGVDGPDFGMHSAGQIVTLFGPPGTNGDRMSVGYITPKSTAGANAFGAYRNPLPMSDGTLVASYTTAAALDSNIGTAASPKSRFNFRLMTLQKSGATWTTNQYLTPGLTNLAIYWSGSTLVTHTNALWELDPVEVFSRSVPARQTATVGDIENQVFTEEGVELSAMQTWLRSNNLALVVSRNVTTRDHADREQPFNLRIAGTTTQTVATNNSGRIYDIRYLQFMQADQLRGLTFGTTTPVPGRRVLAKPFHDPAALNSNLPNTNGPAGAVRLGDDGSQAVFLPARHAMTHQLTDVAGNPIVRERYWLTYQPGEIRTCTSCHGINSTDQAGQPKPTNKPQALRDLLRFWKTQTGYSRILSAGQSNSVFQLLVSGAPNRTNILEASSDWNTWQGIGTNNSSSNGIFWFIDPQYPLNTMRFYRLKTP
jgi:hypothetical protein